jgi:Rad3-related DNA helicase
MADAAILGDYDHAIIDEAHDLEEVAAEYFGAKITTWDFTTPLVELYEETLKPKGLLPNLLEDFTRAAQPKPDFLTHYEACISSVIQLKQLAEKTFAAVSARFQFSYNWQQAEYSIKQRFHPGEPVFEFVKDDLARLAKKTKMLIDDLSFLLSDISEADDDEIDRLSKEISGQIEILNEVADAIIYMTKPNVPDSVYWWESPQRPDSIDTFVCWSPLDVAERMHKVFHSKKKSAVFTSATMSVASDFTYILGRLGLDLLEPERLLTLELGSPYDFQSQLLAIFPEFFPEPNDIGFIPAIADLITKVSEETRVGTLALFTSYRALRQVYSLVSPELAKSGILVLAQGISGGRNQLTRRFIADIESVLLGTESFWQGVDIRGEALQVLFVTKLPFAVPTEPYVAGQSERLQRAGIDPFDNYYVPQAVIKFRQGIGRLIRSETDVGVVVICDKRVGTKRYSRYFLDSLPVEVERVKSARDVISKIKKFL